MRAIIKMMSAIGFCLCILALVPYTNCEPYKCSEPPRDIKMSCTIMNYTGDFEDFELDGDYHRNYIINLTFVNSHFDRLPSKIFEDFPNLTILDLSHSHIKEIQFNTFKSANKLEKLILSNNNLSDLYNYEFFGANQLTYIDLGYNKISQIDGEPFKGLNKLRKVDLSNNEIKTLPKPIFMNLNLYETNLNYNQIKNSSELKSINNGIVSLTNNKLEYLDINDHLGSILHVDNNELQSDAVTTSNTGKLRELTLRNNSLTGLQFIGNMSQLLHLDVSNNPLYFNKEMDSDIFSNLKNLKTLILKSVSSNNFDFATMLNNLPNSIQKLDISFNNITIDFKKLPQNLTELYIQGNRITPQALDEIKYLLPNLKKIDISENYWQCSDLKNGLTLLRQLNIEVVIDKIVKDEINIRGIRCFENSSQTVKLTVENNTNTMSWNLEKFKNDLYDVINETIKQTIKSRHSVCESYHINIVNLILGIVLIMVISFVICLSIYFKNKLQYVSTNSSPGDERLTPILA